jgi:hypothetical protein
VEMFLKILDLGVVLHPGSYCRCPPCSPPSSPGISGTSWTRW